jgi:hypothetical protein
MIVTIITMIVINVECDFSTAGALYVIICSRFNCIQKVEFCCCERTNKKTSKDKTMHCSLIIIIIIQNSLDRIYQ